MIKSFFLRKQKKLKELIIDFFDDIEFLCPFTAKESSFPIFSNDCREYVEQALELSSILSPPIFDVKRNNLISKITFEVTREIYLDLRKFKDEQIDLFQKWLKTVDNILPNRVLFNTIIHYSGKEIPSPWVAQRFKKNGHYFVTIEMDYVLNGCY